MTLIHRFHPSTFHGVMQIIFDDLSRLVRTGGKWMRGVYGVDHDGQAL